MGNVRSILITAFYANGGFSLSQNRPAASRRGLLRRTRIASFKFRFRFTPDEAVIYADFIDVVDTLSGTSIMRLFKQGLDVLNIDPEEMHTVLQGRRRHGADEATVKSGRHSISENRVAQSSTPPNAPVHASRHRTDGANGDGGLKPVGDSIEHSGIIKTKSSSEPAPAAPSRSQATPPVASVPEPAPLNDAVMDSIIGDFLDEF
jgi:hypothetical protein